jgi:hypothetical protein
VGALDDRGEFIQQQVVQGLLLQPSWPAIDSELTMVATTTKVILAPFIQQNILWSGRQEIAEEV